MKTRLKIVLWKAITSLDSLWLLDLHIHCEDKAENSTVVKQSPLLTHCDYEADIFTVKTGLKVVLLVIGS